MIVDNILINGVPRGSRNIQTEIRLVVNISLLYLSQPDPYISKFIEGRPPVDSLGESLFWQFFFIYLLDFFIEDSDLGVTATQ